MDSNQSGMIWIRQFKPSMEVCSVPNFFYISAAAWVWDQLKYEDLEFLGIYGILLSHRSVPFI